jgi:hypothetical protein
MLTLTLLIELCDVLYEGSFHAYHVSHAYATSWGTRTGTILPTYVHAIAGYAMQGLCCRAVPGPAYCPPIAPSKASSLSDIQLTTYT